MIAGYLAVREGTVCVQVVSRPDVSPPTGASDVGLRARAMGKH